MSKLGFDGLVFAGGGCRCFWQAGFYGQAGPAIDLRPTQVAAASAGAALACVSLIGMGETAVANFKRRASDNAKNFYPKHLLGRSPVFPHEGLFRGAVMETINADAFARLQAGPQVQVALTRAPDSRLGPAPRVLAGLVAYKVERMTKNRIHSQWPRRLGLAVEFARADQCKSIEELTDLLLHTSCTPPFTPSFSRDGRPVLDGGLTDNVPLAALTEAQRVLVLLTRRYTELPRSSRVLYVQPSQDIPIGGWDYTSPESIQHAFDLGRRDGDAFAEKYNSTTMEESLPA